jgi:hypothetical protein
VGHRKKYSVGSPLVRYFEVPLPQHPPFFEFLAQRQPMQRCGGSLAQCDLIHLAFTEAALRARRARLARALVAERTAHKPASRLNQLLQQRLGMIPAA